LIATCEPPTAVETVTVNATRLPPAVGDAAFSIIQLDQTQVDTRVRIDRALADVPGVSLFRRTSSAGANPTTQGLSLRSIGPSGAGRALVTLDGTPQNDPFGGWVIWTGLQPETIDGVQVVRGAGAGPYGAGALTGVVALDEMSKPGAVTLDASGGSMGSYRGALATAQPLGKGELFLSASGENSDGWIPVRQGRGAADDALTLQDWSAAARVQVPVGSAVMSARIGAYREDRDAGLVGAASTAKGEDASLTITQQPEANSLGWRLQGWYRHSNLANSSVAVGPGRATTTPANNQYATPANGWGVNAAARGDAGHLTWETGADVRGASGEDRELFRFMGSAFTRNRIAGGRTLVAGAYAEGTWQSGDWLVTGGARLDGWWSKDGHRIETDRTSGAITFQDHPADRSGAVPSGRIGIRRDLGGGLYLRAAGYTGFRPPTLNELYRPFRVGNDVTEANAALKPERLYGGEAAFGGSSGGFAWSGTVFINHLQDAVTNVTIGVGPGTFPAFPGAGFIPAGGTLRQRQNVGVIRAEGVEGEASYAIASTFKLRAAADYTHAVVDGGSQAPQLTGLRPAQAPRFTATAGADWRPTDRFGMFANLRYESARFDDDQNTRRLAPGVTVNAQAEFKVFPDTALYVAVDNLFDSQIETAKAADGTISYDAPRAFRVGVRLRR
jgi:outer membrane receptor protein involved in Fe transport